MEYKLIKEMKLDLVSAGDIANTVPWHGDYVPAEQVELVLKLMETLDVGDFKFQLKPGLAENK